MGKVTVAFVFFAVACMALFAVYAYSLPQEGDWVTTQKEIKLKYQGLNGGVIPPILPKDFTCKISRIDNNAVTGDLIYYFQIEGVEYYTSEIKFFQ